MTREIRFRAWDIEGMAQWIISYAIAILLMYTFYGSYVERKNFNNGMMAEIKAMQLDICKIDRFLNNK